MRPHSLDSLESEIRDHVERETRDNIDRGMAPDQARRAAMVAFGNVAGAREDVRAVWIPVWLEHLGQDVRSAFRSVRRNPIFSLILIATLTVAIGLCTTVFALYHSILLRPLDYPGAERLVSLTISSPDLPPNQDIATNHDFFAWRERASSFDKLLAYTSYDQTMTTGDDAFRVRTASVSDDFWSITDARPSTGRLPLIGERNVAVLSEKTFRTVFFSDAGVLSRTVTIDRVPVTVIGVLPRAFNFQLPVPMRPGMQPNDIDVYRSFTVSPPNPNFAQLLSVVARLKPDVDLNRARAELATVHSRTVNPGRPDRAITNQVEPLASRLVRGAQTTLNVLLAAVVFVLLVACANIANLLLARATVRQREIAVRVSVGAGRARVLRHFLFESAIYSIAGGVIGFVLARWGLRAIVGIYPQAVPRLAESAIHGPVIVIMIGVLAITTLVFGLTPAVSAQRSEVHGILKESARTATPSPRRLRARTVLVCAQLALAVTLLTGAGLMLKSFWRMNDRPAGFEPEHILAMRLDFAPRSSGRAKVEYANRLIARLKAIPGIDAVSVNTHGDLLTHIDVEGVPSPAPDTPTPPIYMNQTSAGFAKVMGLHLAKGRWLTDDEPTPVIVINDTLAKLKFGREDPIGRRIEAPAIGAPLLTDTLDPNPMPTTATIVGVVADLRYTKLDDESTAEFYIPYGQTRSMFRLSLVLKTPGDPSGVLPSVKSAIGEIDSTQKPYDIMRLDDSLSDSIAPRRLNLIVLTIFASTAMLLALVGIYGVMSYSVSQRTHEIGIRSAIGATPGAIVGMVVWQGVLVAAIGIAVGIAGALILTREMTSLLFETEPTDPATFVAAAGMLALAALVASAVPALKAGAVDPIVALRYE